jgi:CDP-diacylglycerol pyrophosphatase
VQSALERHAGAITDAWRPFPVPLAGHPYLAMRVAGADLTANPFDLLADKLPGAKADMGRWTLVVAGAELADGRPGFLLLADQVGAMPGDRASGEELQDHERACR